jgi:hypothetical protein
MKNSPMQLNWQDIKESVDDSSKPKIMKSDFENLVSKKKKVIDMNEEDSKPSYLTSQDILRRIFIKNQVKKAPIQKQKLYLSTVTRFKV